MSSLEGLRVSRVSPGEYVWISRMFLGRNGRLGPDFYQNPEAGAEEAVTDMCRRLSRELVFKCVSRGGRLLGAIRGEVDEQGLHITGMAIERGFRGLGLGKLLVFHLERASRQKNYSAYVLENDSRGLALYQGAQYQFAEALDLDAGYKVMRLAKRGGGWATRVLRTAEGPR